MFLNKFIKSLLLLLSASAVLTACSDDILLPEDGQPDPDSMNSPDYSIQLQLTLDPMGGAEATGIDILNEDPFKEIEDYVDPEKIRIFFFDNEEKFLFESQSRWVKQLEAEGGFKSWLVTVPFYTGANDADDYDWDWEYIREKITSNKFKIAVVVNQPKFECYPDLSKAEEERDKSEFKTFDNSGPNWTKYDTGVKTMFDLHHTQWDPIYTDKGMRGNNAQYEGFYEFIMGRSDDPNKTTYKQRLMMSATSCWVNYGEDLEDTGPRYPAGGSARLWKKPTKDYPIPMYGVQEFDRIVNWTRGTPFNLSSITEGAHPQYKRKSLSLLRSVVKCELLISKNYTKPEYVSMKYPNVYARIEPMDCWSPTDLIWEESHDNCEWQYIFNYGAIARTGDKAGAKSESSENDKDSFIQYRQRISWLYGCWAEKDPRGNPRWTFGTFGISNVVTTGDPHPRIFNPVIQRNTEAICYANSKDATKYFELDTSDSFNDGYYHFVVYCGERNINDPSDLFDMDGDGSGGSGKSPTVSWVFNVGNTAYSVPIRDYGKGTPADYIGVSGKGSAASYESGKVENNNITYDYHKMVYASPNDQNVIPWPLLRNHVYRITIGPPGPIVANMVAPKSLNDENIETIHISSSKSSSRSLRAR